MTRAARGKRKAAVIWVLVYTDTDGKERVAEMSSSRLEMRVGLRFCQEQERAGRKFRIVRYEPAKVRGKR